VRVRRKEKRPARGLAFFCPRAGDKLLLRRSGRSSRSCSGSGSGSRGGSGSSSSSRSSGGSGSRSSASHAGHASLTGHASHASLGISGLRGFSGGLGCFDLGGFGGLRGLGLATSGDSQGEKGGYEERLLHVISFIDRGETWVQKTFKPMPGATRQSASIARQQVSAQRRWRQCANCSFSKARGIDPQAGMGQLP
jgi:hypothetical protein